MEEGMKEFDKKKKVSELVKVDLGGATLEILPNSYLEIICAITF